MSQESVRGTQVVVHFDGGRCIQSRHCVLERPHVLVPNVAGEWIHPDRATPAELLELAHNCPSGVIRCTRLDSAKIESAPVVNTLPDGAQRPAPRVGLPTAPSQALQVL